MHNRGMYGSLQAQTRSQRDLHWEMANRVLTLIAIALAFIAVLLLSTAAAAGPLTQEAPKIVLATDKTLFCSAETATITVSLADVTDLYGYQFEVGYDANLVSANGVFVDTFFDRSNGQLAQTLWNADCTSTPGVCKFAASKLAQAEAVTGSGVVAAISLSGLNAGEFDLTVGNDLLSDLDANPIAHTAAPLHLTVCDFATVSITGKVSLQGRATPMDAGEVTFTDLDGRFGTTSAAFSAADGTYAIENVKVMPGGSNYQFAARHSLYLSNQAIFRLEPGQAYGNVNTQLRGGDANNNGAIELDDLACIGGAFGGAPSSCGATGSSDINADSVVNIFDVVLHGSNYLLTAPQGW